MVTDSGHGSGQRTMESSIISIVQSSVLAQKRYTPQHDILGGGWGMDTSGPFQSAVSVSETLVIFL